MTTTQHTEAADPERTDSVPDTDTATLPGHPAPPDATSTLSDPASGAEVQHVQEQEWEATAPWWAHAGPSVRLQPHQVRRRTRRGTLARLGLAVALVTGAWMVISSTEVPDVVNVANNGLAYTQTNQALIGGCGPIYEFNDKNDESGTVPAVSPENGINYQSYETTVPMYGGFWPEPITSKKTFWDRADPSTLPRPETLLANQYRGDLIVYYTARATPGDVELLRRVAADARRDDDTNLRLRVVPWPEERGRLPDDRKIAFATWGTSQTCQSFVPSALGDFREHAPADQAPGYEPGALPVLQP